MDSFPKPTDANSSIRTRQPEHVRNVHLFFAQELNNSAAICFERGLYERATSSLHTGLKLLIAMDHNKNSNSDNKNGDHSTHVGCSGCGHASGSKRPANSQQQQQQQQQFSCCDHPATLDGCIAFSEQTSFLLDQLTSISCKENQCKTTTTVDRSHDSVAVSCHNGTKKRRISQCSSKDSSKNVTENNCLGYVYRRPIRIPLEGFCCCHRGYTNLLVVIVLNLAIVHHIRAMEGSINKAAAATKTEDIVFLYDLCLDMLHPSSPPPSSPSTFDDTRVISSSRKSAQFEIIIHNNLSQLYKIGGKSSEHHSSLQHLLTSLMVMIERGTRESPGHSGGVVSSSSSGNYWWDSHRWTARARKNGQSSELIEGVLENLNGLMLSAQCADVA